MTEVNGPKNSLEISSLRAGYGRAEVLHSVSLEVKPGEVAAVLGVNGSGKTTLVRCTIGMLKRRGGEIWMMGEEISALSIEDRVRRGISLVPEGRGLFPSLSVEENLLLGGYCVGGEREGIDEIYAVFPRLRQLRRRRARLLSGGEQQMVAIGRGLLARPKILMLDEPTMGLAPRLIQDVIEALRAVGRGGLGILLVEQNAQVALQLANHVYILENGVVVSQGTPASLARSGSLADKYLGVGSSWYLRGQDLGAAFGDGVSDVEREDRA